MNKMKLFYYTIAILLMIFILFAFLPMHAAILFVGVLILIVSLIIIIKGPKKTFTSTENETLPNDYQLINKDQIKTYITNIEPLNEEDKNELKNKKGKRFITILLCLLVLIGIPFLSGNTEDLKESLFMIGLLFILFVVTTIIRFIKNGSLNNNYDNCFKAKLYIYDKKTNGYNEYGPNYYARVWDGNKYVINEWIYLPSTLYNSNEVIVYFKEYENNIKMFIYNKKGI